jgi:hypothetical protein
MMIFALMRDGRVRQIGEKSLCGREGIHWSKGKICEWGGLADSPFARRNSTRFARIANPSKTLLGAVCFYVLLSGMFRVLGGMNMVAVRQVRVVGGLLVVAGFVMFRCFMVVARGMLMMLSCLGVMVSCFL